MRKYSNQQLSQITNEQRAKEDIRESLSLPSSRQVIDKKINYFQFIVKKKKN